MKRGLPLGKTKEWLKVSAKVQSQSDSLNTMTPHFTDYHVEKFRMCCFPLLLVDWSYIKEIPIH